MTYEKGPVKEEEKRCINTGFEENIIPNNEQEKKAYGGHTTVNISSIRAMSVFGGSGEAALSPSFPFRFPPNSTAGENKRKNMLMRKSPSAATTHVHCIPEGKLGRDYSSLPLPIIIYHTHNHHSLFSLSIYSARLRGSVAGAAAAVTAAA